MKYSAGRAAEPAGHNRKLWPTVSHILIANDGQTFWPNEIHKMHISDIFITTCVDTCC